jgi:hypothetical protein
MHPLEEFFIDADQLGIVGSRHEQRSDEGPLDDNVRFRG